MNLRSLFFVFLFTAVVFFLGIADGAESPYKIRIGFPSLAFSYMPFYVAQEKGIYKKYGIESEYIQMGTTIQPQAVVAGNINYFTSVSTGISAAVAGLPLVIVISFCDSSPWVLVTQKDINKPQDLIGKTVALSGIRTSPYYFFQAFLKKSEINEKDVSTINTGGTADSFRALTSNRVVATVLTPPFDDKAVSLGYKKFMQLGDGLAARQPRREYKDDRRQIQSEPTGSGKHLRDLDSALEQRRQTQSQSRARLPRYPAPGAADPDGLRPAEGRRLFFAAGESIAE